MATQTYGPDVKPTAASYLPSQQNKLPIQIPAEELETDSRNLEDLGKKQGDEQDVEDTGINKTLGPSWALPNDSVAANSTKPTLEVEQGSGNKAPSSKSTCRQKKHSKLQN